MAKPLAEFHCYLCDVAIPPDDPCLVVMLGTPEKVKSPLPLWASIKKPSRQSFARLCMACTNMIRNAKER